MIELGQKDVKSVQNFVRYRRGRVAARFCEGGFQENLASIIAVRLETADDKASTAAFNFDEPYLWLADGVSSKSKDVYDAVIALRASCAGVKQKCGALNETLAAKNKWRGAMTTVEATPLELDPKIFQVDIDSIQKFGHMPWLAANRLNACRMGPGTFPMPGYGAFISIEPDENIRQYFALVPSEPVLGEGISLRDLAAFFETPIGGKLFEDKVKVYEMGASCLLFAPYGYIVLAFATERKDDEEQESQQDKRQRLIMKTSRSKAKCAEHAYFWVWTPFAKSGATNMTERTWSERRSVAQAFAKDVEAARPT